MVVIPLYERHTAGDIFRVVQEFLDTLVHRRRCQLLGVVTDGTATMIGCISGLAPRMEKEVEHPIIRVWCGLHQLDLKTQFIFEQALNESYLTKLTALIGFLRRQQNLVSETQTTCPEVSNTRWLSMYSVADWLCKNGLRARAYLAEKNAIRSPNLVWWIFLYALRDLAGEVNAVFVSLQGMSTLVKPQEDRFAGLVERLLNTSGALGLVKEASIKAVDPSKYEINESFVISHAAAENYVNNLDHWVCTGFKTLPKEQQVTVVKAVARMYTLAISKIHSFTTTTDSTPPVTPKEIVTSSMIDLASIIEAHHDRILLHFGEEGIDKIGKECKKISLEYNHGKPIRAAIDGFDHRLASFYEIWQIGDTAIRFPVLVSFCGGIATVFPNTASVEADFSLIGCEKSDIRIALTDLALEGIPHCKKWQRLSPLAS